MKESKLGTGLWTHQDRIGMVLYPSLNLSNRLDIVDVFILCILYTVIVLIVYNFSYISYSLSHMLDKHSHTELQSQPVTVYLQE